MQNSVKHKFQLQTFLGNKKSFFDLLAPKFSYRQGHSPTLGKAQMVQVWPPYLAVLDFWSTIYMMTPGNWARPETWLEIVLLIFLALQCKIQGIFFAKKVVGHNFWTEGPTDLRSTSLSSIFDAFLGDTPLDHIFSHMPICPYAHMPQIWCQADADASLSGANPVPIHPSLLSIQCQSGANPVHIKCPLIWILCQSGADPVPIWCQSSANPVSIKLQSIPIRFQSLTHLMPNQHQSITHANLMSIPD